jgi:hypothetical protein
VLVNTKVMSGVCISISCNSGVSKKLPDYGRLLPKHVGANTWNRGVVQSVRIVGLF